MTDLDDLRPLAEQVLATCQGKGWMLATAESCTGGLFAGVLTDIAGSSAVFDRGFVTYSNEAKMDLLDVAKSDLEAHGAVSGQVATEMAQGALVRSRANIAVSVTGIAGPGGGSVEKPVGTVYFGLAMDGRLPRHERRLFPDEGRSAIRAMTVKAALELVLNAAESVSSR
jgi:nicotinamide-nucleotide amidase